MMEGAVVVGLDGEPLYWHMPPGRSTVALPDSRDLWEVLWEHRENLLGVAHSHPGAGLSGPSQTDVTTFAAVESALGRRLTWWITSLDKLVVLRWAGPEPLRYTMQEVQDETQASRWLDELRSISY